MKKRFKPKINIKKGDKVVVIAGDDKVREPRKVLSVNPAEGQVLIEGVNLVTRHLTPNAQNPNGGIVKEEAPISISNVMLWDAKSKASSVVERKRAKEISYFRKYEKLILKRLSAYEDYDLSKWGLVTAANKGLNQAAKETMQVMGYNVIAENGWVVKVYADGRREQIKEIRKVERIVKIDRH